MRASGEVALATGVDALSEMLDEPQSLAKLLPQVSEFALVDGDEGAFVATIEPATALGGVPLRTRWRRGADAAPRTPIYEMVGRTEEHAVELTVRLRLAPEGEGTRVGWDADVAVSGTLRSVTQRVLPALVNHQIELALRAAAPPGPTSSP